MSEQGEPASKVQWSCFLCSSFREPAIEKLYQLYSVKQRRVGLQCFLFAAIFFDLYIMAVPNGQDVLICGAMAVFLALNLVLLVWCWKGGDRNVIWAAVPHLAWLLALAQLLVQIFLKRNEVTSRDSLGWALLLDYLVYVSLPLRLRYCVMLSIGTCASYLVTVVGLAKSDTHIVQQVSHILNQNVLG